jgi:hypothetical protein
MLQVRLIPTLPPHPLTHSSPPLLFLLPSAQAAASAQALQLPVHIVTDLGRTQARRTASIVALFVVITSQNCTSLTPNSEHVVAHDSLLFCRLQPTLRLSSRYLAPGRCWSRSHAISSCISRRQQKRRCSTSWLTVTHTFESCSPNIVVPSASRVRLRRKPSEINGEDNL